MTMYGVDYAFTVRSSNCREDFSLRIFGTEGNQFSGMTIRGFGLNLTVRRRLIAKNKNVPAGVLVA